ncbi:MAG: hypothetical protein K8S55_00670 [Phycisphaerae bacterium]|nr:hypothetical protein [Phycisphaerae bacterium]
MSQTQKATDVMRSLGGVEDLQNAAAAGLAPQGQLKANAHIHLPPNFSAFQTTRQAVELADEQGVRVLGAGNYYDYSVYAEFAELCRQRGIFPLFGTEIIALIDELVEGGVKINDPGNPGKMYICGKGISLFDDMTPRAAELLDTIRQSDRGRMAAMIDKLAETFKARGFDTALDEAAVIDMVVKRHGCDRDAVYLQERHLAQAFQETLFANVPADKRIETLSRILDAPAKAEDAVAVQGEIRSGLMKAGKCCFVEESFVNFDQAVELIVAFGGIPCYPTLADGASPICDYEAPVEKLIDTLKQNNIHCAEVIPLRNAPDVLRRYVKAMREAGLVVTAGTEHNTLDMPAIEPTCLNEQPVPEDLKEIFLEGAYVVAAHQFLVCNGQCGFVDAAGCPNPAYATAEKRIAAMAKLGAAVIQKFFKDNTPQ